MMEKTVNKTLLSPFRTIICFVIGVILLFFAAWLRGLLLLFIALFLFIVSFLTAIIIRVATFHSKTLWGRHSTVVAILFLCIPLGIVIAFFLAIYMPYIYTPPAITPANLAVYNRCIEFMKNHVEYPNLTLNRYGDVATQDDYFTMRIPSLALAERERLKTVFSEDEIVEIERICEQLDEIECAKVQRDNNAVLFYKLTNYILPDRPGVLHSLDGKNPNEIDTEPLNKNKPFIKIGGDWYMSRHLVARHWRNLNFPIPKSLIDHSLRTKGIDLDKNTEL